MCREYFDVLVADYKMPGNENLQLLQSVLSIGDFPDVPVIIITGYPSLGSAVTSVRFDAFDYITKPLDMEYLVIRIEEAAQQRRLKETIRRSEEFFHMVADFTYDWEYWIAPDGRYVYVSPSCERITGYSRDEFTNTPGLLEQISHPDDRDRVVQHLDEELEQPEVGSIDFRIITRDGKERWIAHACQPVYSSDERWAGQRASNRDITDRKRAEEERHLLWERTQQLQKIETLRVMAGSMAHDFNNLLMGVLGNTDQALRDLPERTDVRQCIETASKAARRATELSRLMLLYSGRAHIESTMLDLSELIREIIPLLESSVSRKAVLKWDLAENLPAIKGDASQLHQVVMNLVLNASEAFGEEGGRISVKVRHFAASRKYLADSYVDDELAAGHYVCLRISDTGCGMDGETLDKIFDPFFTTKFMGRGLGLAAVFGIVRGHKGAIRVCSEPGLGSTVKILFPALDKPAEVAVKESEGDEEWHGQGMILLVDDEEAIRDVGKHWLEIAGFAVLTATDGREAVEVFGEHADEVVCIILDLTMPRMDGNVAFRELRCIRSDVKVILSSGYSEEYIAQRFTGEGLAGFIQKPYESRQLMAALKRVLES
jgi:PAS domain S-box-containing protein